MLEEKLSSLRIPDVGLETQVEDGSGELESVSRIAALKQQADALRGLLGGQKAGALCETVAEV